MNPNHQFQRYHQNPQMPVNKYPTHFHPQNLSQNLLNHQQQQINITNSQYRANGMEKPSHGNQNQIIPHFENNII